MKMIYSHSILLIGACFLVSCNSTNIQHEDNKSPCHQRIYNFEQLNFENWEALNNCSFEALTSYFPDWEEAEVRASFCGKKYTPTKIRTFLRAENEVPKAVYYQETSASFTKIAIEYPGIEDPKTIIELLGVPDLKLDYYLDVILFEKGEWVYLEKGLAFRFGDQQEVLWEMFLFNPCDKQHYKDEIYYSEQVREFPIHIN